MVEKSWKVPTMIVYDLQELIKLTKANASPGDDDDSWSPEIDTCNEMYDDKIGSGPDFSECWAEGPLIGCNKWIACAILPVFSMTPEIE